MRLAFLAALLVTAAGQTSVMTSFHTNDPVSSMTANQRLDEETESVAAVESANGV